MPHSCTAPLLAALVLAGLAAGAARAAAPGGEREVCRTAIARIERETALPEGLLQAIALAESGRWDKVARQGYAWPWTVTNGGAGTYFADRAAALAEVARLRGLGRTNIDVGCLQVNLHYHGHAFASPDAAIEPEANARYAAGFLRRLFEETGSWERAVAFYHSRTPERGRAYRERVYARWERLAPGVDVPAPVEGPAEALAAAAREPTPVGRWARALFGWLTPAASADAAALFGRRDGPATAAPPALGGRIEGRRLLAVPPATGRPRPRPAL